ncbi:MAG: UDP-N-acetylmuramate dehydrogenase [Candidatus Paceibacterota bacterium]
MQIKENIPLAQYTTFKIGGPARFFCEVASEEDLVEAVKFSQEKNIPYFVLGSGSNLLISDAGFAGLVIKMELKGVTFSDDRVSAAAGEIWDDLVAESVSRGFCGLENLSAIPGTVGAVAVQNIGAYGVDIGDVLESVRVLDTQNLNFSNLSKAECAFAYRDSIFKHQKGRHIISRTVFKLTRDGRVNIEYKDLVLYFKEKNLGRLPTPAEVREAVIGIRAAKLPDWKQWGTAGSYFKNPIISLQQSVELKLHYPDLPSYPEPNGFVKVSLGWIIDKVCKLKGKGHEHVYLYEKQALVIVARSGATASEVMELSREIANCVFEKTGIKIEAEVEWVN